MWFSVNHSNIVFLIVEDCGMRLVGTGIPILPPEKDPQDVVLVNQFARFDVKNDGMGCWFVKESWAWLIDGTESNSCYWNRVLVEIRVMLQKQSISWNKSHVADPNRWGITEKRWRVVLALTYIVPTTREALEQLVHCKQRSVALQEVPVTILCNL